MLMDWKAASERHPGGMNIACSIDVSSWFLVGEAETDFIEDRSGGRLDLTSVIVPVIS
jgi:hypothetical protein